MTVKITHLKILLVAACLALSAEAKPNVLFVLADQWRAQATTWENDPNLAGKTPVLDKLASESVNFKYAVACTPVCTPYRGSFLTGQYPLKHKLIVNDVSLSSDALSIAEVYSEYGYDTAYIGKWHVDGRGRTSYIPRERRQGFDYWKVLECTHDYNQSAYYAQDDATKKVWPEYDAFAQTKDAQAYIANRKKEDKPFLMVLSWGPPHNPYETAPESYRQLFDPQKIVLRKNVKDTPGFRKDLAGYYAHIVALDKALGGLLQTLDEKGLREETIVVFTSDHGDMLGSQNGETRKQRPWDEAIRVPLLIRYPAAVKGGRVSELLINTPDLMPTLLGLSGVGVPRSVQGENYAPLLRGEQPEPADSAALIACYTPFGEWTVAKGGREYRGVRTKRYTYVRSLEGPWLLYDNEVDPYQLENKVNEPALKSVREKLEGELARLLKKTDDDFRPGKEYLQKFGYHVDPKTGHSSHK
jgi:arylsulfatase A-like enzyme